MSTSIVTITTVDEIVTVGNDGTAQHVFTIRNDTGAPVRVGIQTVVDAPVSKEWISVDKPERELGENDADQVSVTVKTPGDLAAGRYTYRIRVYSVKQPGEAFTEGEAVAFEIAGKVEEKPEPVKEKKKCGWCIPVAIGVLILALGIGAYIAFMPSDAPVVVEEDIKMSNYKGKFLEQAMKDIEKKGLVFTNKQLTTKWGGKNNIHKIIDQKPHPNTMVKSGETVLLTVGEDKRGFVIPMKQAVLLQQTNPKIYMQVLGKKGRMIAPENGGE